jgi:hypothetical protein
MVVSPLTLMELCCQLTVKDAGEVQEAFDALKLLSSIANPNKLLPKTDQVVTLIQTGLVLIPFAVDGMAVAIAMRAVQAASPYDMQALARHVRDDIGKQKSQITDMVKRTAEKIRKTNPTVDDFRREFAQNLAKRAGLSDTNGLVELSKGALSAYFEYRTELNRRAATSRKFNFTKRKNLNDIWDAEQLVYLGHPDLRFITCDAKFASIGAQSDRIHVFKPSEMSAPEIYPILTKLAEPVHLRIL